MFLNTQVTQTHSSCRDVVCEVQHLLWTSLFESLLLACIQNASLWNTLRIYLFLIKSQHLQFDNCPKPYCYFIFISINCVALQVVLAEGRGVKVAYMDPLPPLRPSRCGERVAVCCVLVGVGMCRRVGKQAVVWLVKTRGEGPFILVWCLRFAVLFSLSPSVPQGSVFAWPCCPVWHIDVV